MPLETLSPLSFLRFQVAWPLVSAVRVATQCADTVNILTVLPGGRLSKVMSWPVCRSDRQGLGWTLTEDKPEATSVKLATMCAEAAPLRTMTDRCCSPFGMGRGPSPRLASCVVVV